MDAMPLLSRVEPMKKRAVELAQTTRTVHRTEPVAVVNVVRLLLLAGMSFGLKMTGNQLLTTMAAAEGILTLWTRSQVSPRGYDHDRRTSDSADSGDAQDASGGDQSKG